MNELFQNYEQMMFKIAIGILNNFSDAEDAVQNTFLYIFNNLETISQIPCDKRSFYFANIVKHQAIDIYRKRARHKTEDIELQFDLSSNECVEKTALSNVTVSDIKSAMSELSDRDYELLYLYLFEEKSSKEISDKTGISECNIREYIRRARERFKKILRKMGIDYDF